MNMRRIIAFLCGVICVIFLSFNSYAASDLPSLKTPKLKRLDLTPIKMSGMDGAVEWDLQSKCIAYYKLDERAANRSINDSAHGRNQANSIDANTFDIRAEGKVDGALDFDGTDDKIDCGSDFIGATALTITAWVNLTSFGENNLGFIVANDKVLFRVNTTNDLLQFSSDNATLISSANNSISTGLWQFVCATRDTSGVANLYINGILSGTANQNSGTPAGGTNVLIGNRALDDRTFDGLIDNLMIFDEVLTLKEMDYLYNYAKGVRRLYGIH